MDAWLERELALARTLDANVPFDRGRFALPEGVVYLDGNSLGALPTGVAARLEEAVRRQWGEQLISSWNPTDTHHGWMDLSERVGDRIAALVGARAGDVHVGDSTSVSLFKTMVAALRLRPDRPVVVVERSTFPTDAYVASGVAELTGAELRFCDTGDVAASLDEDVALLSLTHVDFRTGAMLDLAGITAHAHDAGALVQWDLCHSAGAVPVDLEASGADLAVGCTYKYLNGGPGSPAFTWVAPALQGEVAQPITGWMGHASPFAMTLDYAPRDGVRRMASGTPPVLALTALDAALDAFEGVSMDEVRRVSLSLTDLVIRLVEEHTDLEVVTPPEHDRRGSQVSLRHPHAYGVVQALIARGVVGDFRDPDIARFGFAPLYVTHEDVVHAVAHLVDVLEGQEHLSPAYAHRHAVT